MPNPRAPSQPWPARLWTLISKAALRYNDIDGEQRAAAFAYYAFFSLFPLIVLLVTIIGGSLLKDEVRVAQTVTDFIHGYMPDAESEKMILKTIDGVIKSRGSAGIIAFLTLAWSSLRFFQALVRGINRAWGTHEYAWWHLPLKNLGMVAILASALVLGSVLPAILSVIVGLIPFQLSIFSGVYQVAILAIPLLILWYALTLFYKYAPQQQVAIQDIWIPSLTVTALLKLVQFLFGYYVVHYSNFNLIYGAFASVMVLLLWIYLSGSLIIYGGCLCAVVSEEKDSRTGRKTGRRSAVR